MLIYLQGVYGEGTYNFSDSIYIPEAGHFEVYGSSDTNTNQCQMDTVQYNRTSPNPYYVPSWKTASAHNPDWSLWKTDVNDHKFIEGWHEVCCLPTSKDCSSGNCGDFIIGNSSCQKFCIDETAPGVPSVSFDNPSQCEPNYINEAPEFSWYLEDNGCAPLSYDVEIYFSNGTLYYSVEDMNQTSLTIANKEYFTIPLWLELLTKMEKHC